MTIEQLHNTINVLFITTAILIMSSSLATISGINNWNEIIITIGVIGMIIGGIGFTVMLAMMGTANKIEREENENED